MKSLAPQASCGGGRVLAADYAWEEAGLFSSVRLDGEVWEFRDREILVARYTAVDRQRRI